MNTLSKKQQCKSARDNADVGKKIKQYRRHRQHRDAHKTSPWDMLDYIAGDFVFNLYYMMIYKRYVRYFAFDYHRIFWLIERIKKINPPLPSRQLKEEIRQYITDNYYKIDFTLDEIRESYQFDESCQGTVPQALEAFFEAESYEDAIRNAISIGGDSDTIAAITGSVAEAYYGIPEDIKVEGLSYLDDNLRMIHQVIAETIKKLAPKIGF